MLVSIFLLCFIIVSFSFKIKINHFIHKAHLKDTFNSNGLETDDEYELMKYEIDKLINNQVSIENNVSEEKEKSFIENLVSFGKSQKDKQYLAGFSAILGSILFVSQHVQPTTDVSILRAMEKDSVKFEV